MARTGFGTRSCCGARRQSGGMPPPGARDAQAGWRGAAPARKGHARGVKSIEKSSYIQRQTACGNSDPPSCLRS
eukprot:scaffold1112_cov116-Isochrysis_galbana.AAC.52